MEPCPICSQPIEFSRIGNRDAYTVTCAYCGQYSLARTALVNLRNTDLSQRQRANISGWLRENSNFELSTSNIDSLENLKTPSFLEKASKLILQLDKLTNFAGEVLQREPHWRSYAWCVNEEEFDEIMSYLEHTSQIEVSTAFADRGVKILPNGWQHIEKLSAINTDSNQGFVAMWFSDEMQTVYDEAISIGILEAGYRPHKVDQREHSGKIDDEIIAQIRRSRFVLADFTGHRGGVYFEAGFAKGMNIEVIWSCREDDVENLHFDIRQYNCIVWRPSDMNEFRKKISNRVEAVLGRGNYQLR